MLDKRDHSEISPKSQIPGIVKTFKWMYSVLGALCPLLTWFILVEFSPHHMGLSISVQITLMNQGWICMYNTLLQTI